MRVNLKGNTACCTKEMIKTYPLSSCTRIYLRHCFQVHYGPTGAEMFKPSKKSGGFKLTFVTFVCSHGDEFHWVDVYKWFVWQLELSRQLEIAVSWFKNTKIKEETWCPVALEGSGTLSESTDRYHLGVRHNLLHAEHKRRKSHGACVLAARTWSFQLCHRGWGQ